MTAVGFLILCGLWVLFNLTDPDNFNQLGRALTASLIAAGCIFFFGGAATWLWRNAP
jgi:hypothetical protein